jgi:hypothetical protein
MTPNPYDQACRYLAKKNPQMLSAWILPNLPKEVRYSGWLDTRSIPFPGESERVCDTVAHFIDSQGPRHWAIAIEFQLKPAVNMFGRLLEYLGRLWLELRLPDHSILSFRVGAAVINLTGRGNASRTMELGDTGLRTVLHVVEKNLADDDAQAVLDAIATGDQDRFLLPWIPLMQGGHEASIIRQWKELAMAETDKQRRGDFAGLALVFAEAAGCRTHWREALMGWNMEISQQVLEWQAEALQRGKAEGKAEGKVEGKAEGKAEALLKVLRIRFGKRIPRKLQQTLLETADLARLEQWLELALRVDSLESFREAASF